MTKMLLYYAVLFGLVLILCVTCAVFFPRAQFTPSTFSQTPSTTANAENQTEVGNDMTNENTAGTASTNTQNNTLESRQTNHSDDVTDNTAFDFVLSQSSQSLSGTEMSPEYDADDDSSKDAVTVYLTKEDSVITMPQSEFVAEVLMGEVTAAFPDEALRAMAVAIRTYLVRRTDTISAAHPTAQICDDHTHCLAMCSLSDAREKWGETVADSFYTRALQAATDTQGEILTYQGDPIDAVFHAMSYGYTTDACQVWGNDVPYLISVETPETRELTNMIQSTVVTAETFTSAFGKGVPSAVYDAHGRLETLSVGKRTFSSTEVRTALHLSSNAMTFQTNDDGSYTFTTYGAGHGVGLSQRGAEIYAQAGKNYQWILAHYYPGTTLTTPSSAIA